MIASALLGLAEETSVNHAAAQVLAIAKVADVIVRAITARMTATHKTTVVAQSLSLAIVVEIAVVAHLEPTATTGLATTGLAAALPLIIVVVAEMVVPAVHPTVAIVHLTPTNLAVALRS